MKNLLLLASGLVLLACGDSSISLADLPEEGNKQICSRLVECNSFADEESCQQSIDNFSAFSMFEADVEAGLIEYNGSAAKRCVDAVEDFFGCDVTSSRFLLKPPNEIATRINEECAEMFVGTVAEGGNCFEAEHCSKGLSCRLNCSPGECCAGVCAQATSTTLAKVGESCATDDTVCVDSAFCDDELCVERPQVGEACIPGTCSNDAICDYDFEAQQPGVCLKLSNEDEECDPSLWASQCLRRDTVCDPSDNKCKPRVGLEGDCSTLPCVEYAECVDDICVPRPGPGDACVGVDRDTNCVGGDLVCQNEQCVLPTALYCPLGQ